MELKIGDKVITKDPFGVKDMNGYFFKDVTWNGPRIIIAIESEYIQLDGDHSIWFFAKDFTTDCTTLEFQIAEIQKEIYEED